MYWYWISLLLFGVGLFKEFRPSEPFVTTFITDYKNVTKDELVQKIYPVSTYTNLAVLPLVFLITDILRYKLVIIAEMTAFLGCYALLLWADSFISLQIVQFLYGFGAAAEIAYYTYMYAKVEKSLYRKVTSYAYTAIIVGNLTAAICSQVMVSTELMNYRDLNYLTLISTFISLLLSLFLPKVSRSLYFHRKESILSNKNETGPATFTRRIKKSMKIIWYDLKCAFNQVYVVKWSIWWAMASAGSFQIVNYVQALWETISENSEEDLYNAATDAVHRIISVILALLVGHVYISWNKWGELLLFCMSLIQAAMLILMSQTTTLTVAYVTYVIYRVSFQTMITVASAEVAEHINPDSYGLIFGINGFFALAIQSLITFIVTDDAGLALSERDQFFVYGCYHGALGLIFGLFCLTSCFKRIISLRNIS